MNDIKRILLKHLSKMAKPYLKSIGLLQTSKIFNKTAIMWEPKDENVAVLAPHFDDEVIGCGGSLYKHIQNGAEVTVIFLTDGSSGNKAISGFSIKENKQLESKYANLRRCEAELALKTLGIKNYLFLSEKDSGLASTKELQNRLRTILYSINPDIVYLPFFLEEHPDHRITNQILIDTVEDESLQFDCMGYEVWTPLFPNVFVSIDNVVEKKKAALYQYKSQLQNKDFIHTNLSLNAFRSIGFLDNNIRYAEAFFCAPLKDYRNLYNFYKTF